MAPPLPPPPQLYNANPAANDRPRLPSWITEYRDQSGWGAVAARHCGALVATVHDLWKNEIPTRAAALTYHTLLSIMPLFAVIFAVLQRLGTVDRMTAPLRRWIIDNIAAGRVATVGRWIDRTLDHIATNAIAGIGFIFVVYAALNLLTTSERTFNRIWGIRSGRSLARRLVIYLLLITLGPLLFVFSISLSSQIEYSVVGSWIFSWFPPGLGHGLLRLGSAVLICLLLSFAYLAVPNTPVYWKAAAIAGTTSGLIWIVVKTLFFELSGLALRYSALYGALGALPLLMLWFYASWIVILSGVTYTHALDTEARRFAHYKALRSRKNFPGE